MCEDCVISSLTFKHWHRAPPCACVQRETGTNNINALCFVVCSHLHLTIRLLWLDHVQEFFVQLFWPAASINYLKMAREAYQVMGIKFAPLMIPLERRLQTLAVLYWIATFLFMAGITSVILTILAFTSYRWITILYITWLVYDWNTPYTGGRKNK